MPTTFITGDLFTTPDLDGLAQGVNCVGKMRRGIADKFRRLYPRMFEEYEQICARRELFLGNIHVYRAPDGGPWIFNLATQERTGPHADLEAVRMAVLAMVRSAEKKDLRRVGLPRIGCGIGGLAWQDVRSLLETIGAKTSVELVVVSLPTDTD